MKTCPNCNSQVADDHVFCMECGTRIEMEPAPVQEEAKTEEPQAEPVEHMTDVENHIMWNIQPGQVARLITEKEFLQYSDAAGLIINNGARVLIRQNADELVMLSNGIYSFKEPLPVTAPVEEKKRGFFNNIIGSVNASAKKDKLDFCSILLVRDGDFPVIFGGADSTGDNFVPMTIPARNLNVEVGLSAMVRIASMQVFAAKHMIDRTHMNVGELVALVAPKVEKVLREVLADVYVSESGVPEAVKTEIQDRLKALTPELGGIAISSVEEVRFGHEALERFRALNSELYLTERELEYLERTNEFKNRLSAAQNAQQVNEARNELDLYKKLQAINQDKILAEDELEKFYMVLSRERRIREAQNEDQIAAAMADIERTGLVRTEDLNRLKDDIRTSEHKRGHAFRMMQKKDEIELISLQREYELRVRDEDYQFEKRKKDDEFDRFKELERMKREKEAAEHDRNMEALRQMQQAKIEKMRLSRELTPEQLMALSAENLSPEAAAKLAESLGRNREADYLERVTQARIDDMKDMMKMGNETSREYIRASASGAAPAQQPGKFCPSCGNRNNADAKFCMSCGTPLN